MNKITSNKTTQNKGTSGKTASKKNNGRNPGGRHLVYQLNVILLCTVTLVALGSSAFFLYREKTALQEQQRLAQRLDALEGTAKTLYTEEEVEEREETARKEGAAREQNELKMQIQSDMESGGGTASMLRKLFDDDVVVVSGGKYYFYPTLNSVQKNSFASDDFSLSDDGRLQYGGEDKVSLQSGIDVSEKNGDIEWKAVAEDDIGFVMICAGGLTDADGKGGKEIRDDERTEDNIAGAYEAGLHVGIYYTLGANSREEAKEEAQHLTERLSDYKNKITYPVAVWANRYQNEDGTAAISKSEWTGYVSAFCRAVEDAGYQTMIYGNLASFVMNLELEQLENYDKWIANTGAGLYFPYRFSMWQYATTGTVQGISNEVGLDASLSLEK